MIQFKSNFYSNFKIVVKLDTILVGILCNLTEIFVQFDTTLVKFYSNLKICQIGYNFSQNFIQTLFQLIIQLKSKFVKLDTILFKFIPF